MHSSNDLGKPLSRPGGGGGGSMGQIWYLILLSEPSFEPHLVPGGARVIAHTQRMGMRESRTIERGRDEQGSKEERRGGGGEWRGWGKKWVWSHTDWKSEGGIGGWWLACNYRFKHESTGRLGSEWKLIETVMIYEPIDELRWYCRVGAIAKWNRGGRNEIRVRTWMKMFLQVSRTEYERCELLEEKPKLIG